MEQEAERIPVTRSSMPTLEEFVQEIQPLWDSHMLTNMGVMHQELQRQLEQFFGIPHVVLYTNGHLALENALAAFHFSKGSEVITTPLTFASTTHAIQRNGLVPVFCDANGRDHTLDATKLEALITPRTVAILPVHVYGNLCDAEAIGAIAQRHGLRVIYDAAHAFGVRYKGTSSACFGDMTMFSFHATKVFQTIEGGCICFRNDAWVQPLNDQKNFGFHGPEEIAFAGGNAKMSEFQAAMGLCNLRHLGQELAKRRQVAEHYHKRLGSVPGLRLLAPQPHVEPNYAYFPVVFEGYRYTRDEVQARLAAQNIDSRKYFYPLTNSYACYRGQPAAGVEKTPVAQHMAERVLTLPLYADLPLQDVDRICDIILN